MNEWEAKYKALSAGLSQDSIDTAASLVATCVKISGASGQPFESVFYGMIQAAHLIKPRPKLTSITDQPCQCPDCDWSGTVWECEPDIDGEGSLGCPNCNQIIEVYVRGNDE